MEIVGYYNPGITLGTIWDRLNKNDIKLIGFVLTFSHEEQLRAIGQYEHYGTMSFLSLDYIINRLNAVYGMLNRCEQDHEDSETYFCINYEDKYSYTIEYSELIKYKEPIWDLVSKLVK